MPFPGGNLLSLQSVAARLDCSTRTVQRLVAKGLLPRPIKAKGLGNRWLTTQIDAYLIGLLTGKPDDAGGR